MNTERGDSEFDQAARRFVQSAIDDAEPEANDLRLLVDGMSRMMAARLRSSGGTAASLAVDAVSEFWAAARRGLVDVDRRPAAYLTVIARNLVIQELARQRSELQLDSEVELGAGEEDVRLEAVLDRYEALVTLDQLRSRAIGQGDSVAVRVITAWLDLAEQLPRAPTSRQVAHEAGLSHTTVNRALARLRARL